MGNPGDPVNPNFKPKLAAPLDWKLAKIPNSGELKSLPPPYPEVVEPPQGAKQKISELELAQKLLAQIEQATEFDCRGFKCSFGTGVAVEKVRKGFIQGFKQAIGNPQRPIGRQNLLLGTYCPRPENLIYGFKELVERGVNHRTSKGKKLFFNDLQGQGTASLFTSLIILQCGKLEGFEAFYKHVDPKDMPK